MTRNIAVLMIGIVFFNLAGNCFPQSIDVESQAKADAETDVNEAVWFLLGAMVPLGCLIGCTIGTAIDSESGSSGDIVLQYYPLPNDSQVSGACIGGAVGLSMLQVGHLLRPAKPTPERLLGKPPKYVSAYTSAYEQQTQSSRIKSAASGFAIGTAISCLLGRNIWIK